MDYPLKDSSLEDLSWVHTVDPTVHTPFKKSLLSVSRWPMMIEANLLMFIPLLSMTQQEEPDSHFFAF